MQKPTKKTWYAQTNGNAFISRNKTTK